MPRLISGELMGHSSTGKNSCEANLKYPVAKCGLCLHLQARAIAIVPGRRSDAPEFRTGSSSLAMRRRFSRRISFLISSWCRSGVLVVASAAAGEMRAGRRDAVRGRLDDGGGLSAREAGLFFGDGGVDFFSGKNKGNEDGLAASAVLIG